MSASAVATSIRRGIAALSLCSSPCSGSRRDARVGSSEGGYWIGVPLAVAAIVVGIQARERQPTSCNGGDRARRDRDPVHRDAGPCSVDAVPPGACLGWEYADGDDGSSAPELRLTEPMRVLVADDSADFREGIAALLASVDGLELVGEAVDGDEAVAGALDLQPDVVLMDLHMPRSQRDRGDPGDRRWPLPTSPCSC